MRNKEKRCKKLCLLLASSLVLTITPPTVALANNSLKIYSYTSKSMMSVPNTQVAYLYNGIAINLAGTPGILTSNNVALAPYIPIFRDKLGIKTLYDKGKKTVTFKNGSTTLILTLGSKTAKLNGKAVSMNAAPISVKYTNNNKTCIMVPTRFVAETFGFNYEWDSKTATVSINKALQLRYDNQTVSYRGVSGGVSFDGKSINVTNLPTIIMGNTAMIQAYRVFRTRLGVDYKYNPKTNQLTFKKGDITLEMQLDSSIAYLNGQAVDCGAAPKLVLNQETSSENVLVPGQFVAKALGYNYSWNSNRKVSEITSSDNVGVKPNIVISSSSSKGNQSTKPNETKGKLFEPIQYFNWNQATGITTLITDAKDTTGQLKTIESTNQNTAYLSNVIDIPMTNETETIQLQFSTPYSKVLATQEGTTITLLLENTFSVPNQYNYFKELFQNSQVVYDAMSMTTKVIFTTAQENAYYKLIPSEDNLSVYITVYPNYLTNLVAGRDEIGNPYLTLTGLTAFQPIVTEDENNVYVQLPFTKNGIGDMIYSTEFSEDNLIDYVILQTPTERSSFLMIHKPTKEATYELKHDGTSSTIYFPIKESIPTYEKSAIQVVLPQGVTAKSISDEDRYYNRQILINMPGDHRRHYESNPISNTYDSVSNINVTYNSQKGQTVITVTTNKIQGYKYTVKNNLLTLEIDQPSKFYDKIVILDAGHGGYDPGAVKEGLKEKDVNYSVLNVYAQEYFNNSGIKVYYTRVDDTLIPLADRAKYAIETEADLFISLHCNAATNTSAKGTGVYYSSTNKSIGITGLTSKILASSLVNSLSASMGTKNNGTIDKGFVVVRDNSVPAVLIELAFLTNSEDRAKLASPTYQKKAAQAIYKTVVDIFNAYPTNR